MARRYSGASHADTNHRQAALRSRAVKLTGVVLLLPTFVFAQPTPTQPKATAMTYEKSLVDFDAFKQLVSQVEAHRAKRLIDLETFLKMSKAPKTVIFDSRSDFRFGRKHLKGAIHLDFTDFTQTNLQKLIPDPNTTILIYCNNNFSGDQVDFATKMFVRPAPPETQILGNQKPLMLALNIPTYINLFGYGYRNVYELNELVSVTDPRIKFEGTVVKK